MILESSPAGIAYLKGETLVRCNRRFERMLGLLGNTLTGKSLDTLINHDPRIKRLAVDSVPRLQSEGQFESELEIIVPGHPTMWYALSIKRIGSQQGPLEAIAVLSDITRIRSQKPGSKPWSATWRCRLIAPGPSWTLCLWASSPSTTTASPG